MSVTWWNEVNRLLEEECCEYWNDFHTFSNFISMRTQSESLDRKNESQNVCKIISVCNMQVFRERLAFCDILWLNTVLHKLQKNPLDKRRRKQNST